MEKLVKIHIECKLTSNKTQWLLLFDSIIKISVYINKTEVAVLLELNKRFNVLSLVSAIIVLSFQQIPIKCCVISV